METAYYYLGLSAVLTALLWLPYILARAFTWGIPGFLHSYPANQPDLPLWAQRAHRAHLNMVETLPIFIGVVLAAGYFSGGDAIAAATIAKWAEIFFIARLVHPVVYILKVPYLRTPTYLVSWAAMLIIATTFI